MLRTALKTLWRLVTLPITLILLPFKVASLLISLVVYGTVLLVLGLVVVLFVL